MKKELLLKVGAIAFFSAIGLNLQYAWANYGITKQPLHMEVLAQSNDSGGGGGTSDNPNSYWNRSDSDCSITVYGAANAEATILGIKVKFDAKGMGKITVENAATSCETGGKYQCKSLSCGEFWMANGLGT